jgi:hypothetical protein
LNVVAPASPGHAAGASVLAGGEAQELLEVAGEVALVREADLGRHLRGVHAALQQAPGAGDAELELVA